jgi:Ni/Co efflux regulator RcnB
MKKLMIAGLALSIAAGGALPAAAQEHRGRDRDHRVEERQDRREFRQERRQDQREFRQERRQDQRAFRQDQRQDRRAFQQAQRRYQAGRYYAPRGYAVRHWSAGQRLPRAYYAQPYAIRDYRSYGLYAPPAGYQWTRVGDDAVLTAVVSGLIGAVVGGLFF